MILTSNHCDIIIGESICSLFLMHCIAKEGGRETRCVRIVGRLMFFLLMPF